MCENAATAADSGMDVGRGDLMVIVGVMVAAVVYKVSLSS